MCRVTFFTFFTTKLPLVKVEMVDVNKFYHR